MSENRTGRGLSLTAVLLVVVLLLAVAGIVAAVTAASDGGYRLKVAMPSALGLDVGTPVQLDGRDVGRIDALEARGDQAVATIELPDDDRDVAVPLHAGTRVRVESRSVLGERFLYVDPGPASGPELPDGTLIPAGAAQVTLEDVFATLDPPTRTRLASVVRELGGTLGGRERDLNETLRTVGPTVDALSSVLEAAGDDGPAIRELVSNAEKVTSVLAQRRGGVESTVRDLGTLTGAVAEQQKQLSAGLAELPGALDAAKGALDKVPDATDAAVPLLEDLRPSTARLPSVARNLRPVLADLRPTVARLKPTLEAAQVLLGETPGLLDRTHDIVPQLTEAVRKASPAVAFLRPYTPETVGFLTNWGNFFSQYDNSGHLARALFTGGQTSINGAPPAPLPGGTVNPAPPPGSSGGQPWTDAAGQEAK